MKFFSVLFFLFLFSCHSKQVDPELDYMKMEIFPGSLHPSTINLDLKKTSYSFLIIIHKFYK